MTKEQMDKLNTKLSTGEKLGCHDWTMLRRLDSHILLTEAEKELRQKLYQALTKVDLFENTNEAMEAAFTLRFICRKPPISRRKMVLEYALRSCSEKIKANMSREETSDGAQSVATLQVRKSELSKIKHIYGVDVYEKCFGLELDGLFKV